MCFSRFSSQSCTPRAPTTIRESIAVRILHGSAQENIRTERETSVTGSKMSVHHGFVLGPPFRPSYTRTKHRNRQRRLLEYYCPIGGPLLPAKLEAKAQQTAGLSLKMVPGQLRVYNSLTDLQTTHARFPRIVTIFFSLNRKSRTTLDASHDHIKPQRAVLTRFIGLQHPQLDTQVDSEITMFFRVGLRRMTNSNPGS